MALRTRKPAKQLVDSTDEDEVKKPAAKANRRKTVAGPAALATEKVNYFSSFTEAILGLCCYIYFVYDMHQLLIYETQAPSRSVTPNPEPGYTQATKQSSRRLSIASTISDVPSERPNGHIRESPIGSAVFPPRSSTSASMRPESSMSSRGHSIPPAPLVAKKARTPAQPRVPAQPKSDPSKTSRVRRKSPLNETAGPTQNPEPVSRNFGVVLPSIEPNPQSADVDSLTAAMGSVSINNSTSKPLPAKTKIKLITPLQREQQKLAAQAGAKSTSKPTKPLLSKPPNQDIPSHAPILPTQATTSTSMPQPKHEKIAPTPQVTNPILPRNPLISTPPQVPLPPNSPLAPKAESEPQSKATPQPEQPDSNNFIPYQPEGPPAISLAQKELHFLPPNTSTPANMKRERGELPVWTANSVIPFGVPTPKAE